MKMKRRIQNILNLHLLQKMEIIHKASFILKSYCNNPSLKVTASATLILPLPVPV